MSNTSTPEPAVTPQEAPPPENYPPGEKIANLLIGSGHLTEKQFRYAKRVRSKLLTPKRLLEVIEDLGFITHSQLQKALQAEPAHLQVGSLLIELGYLAESQLHAALAIQKQYAYSRMLGDILVGECFVDEAQLVEALSYQLGIRAIEPTVATIDRQLVSAGSLKAYAQHFFLPLRKEGNRIVIAFADPKNCSSRETAERIFREEILPVLTTKTSITDVVAYLERDRDRSTALAATTDDDSVVGMVNLLLEGALAEGASDIHIEPMKERVRVRLRTDGVLMPYNDFPVELATGMISRIKVLAGVDITEKRRHQGGKILFEDFRLGTTVDMRVSCYVTVYGEKVVIRILNRTNRF